MDHTYFVLRIEPSRPPAGRRGKSLVENYADAFDPSNLRSALPGGVMGYQAETQKKAKIIAGSAVLSEAKAAEAAQDPKNTLAQIMPISLVQPLASGDLDVAGSPEPVAAATSAKASWGVAEVGADTSPYTGANVRVAVLDTGIVKDHPAFAGVKIIARNFTDEGAPDDVTDAHGHGTHCAGTIFGRDVDGVRIGIARGVTTAIIGKVLRADGGGTTESILSALQWAREQKADVISMSIGFDFPGMQAELVARGLPQKPATSLALKSYRDNLLLFQNLVAFLAQEGSDLNGAVFVAAAGNESVRDGKPPFVIDASVPASASPLVVSVGATMQDKNGLGIAPFSNVNPVLCAPGVNIVSASRSGGLAAMSGTSMACPHVAGLAALWWEAMAQDGGSTTGGLVRAKLIGGARSSGFTQSVNKLDRGAGRAAAPGKP
jgi:subtilisin family serine protease